ncbi:hypothetical protein EPN95_04575 [Patescibacteria group bacterium]|nr:MAG: hypothetical protein EPN95_04575 [Patescibacteria group bacterium]
MQNQGQAQREMPRYKCHKEVRALKIKAIEFNYDKAQAEQRATGGATPENGSATITPADARFASFKVGADYVHKHRPEVGGYYVVYADGYQSFSPAKAFEDGYSPVG